MPPALAALFATATGHHRQAHDAWNKVLTDAGRAEVTAPPAKLQEALNAACLRQFDMPAAVNLGHPDRGLRLPDLPAGMPTLEGPDALRLAAQVAVAGYQRQAVLRYLLGLDPVQQAGADPRFALITG